MSQRLPHLKGQALDSDEKNKIDSQYSSPLLPLLPVPDLAESCRLYLDSVKQLVTAQQFAKTESAVDDFIKQEGRR